MSGDLSNSSFRKGKEAVLVPVVLRKVLEIKEKAIPLPLLLFLSTLVSGSACFSVSTLLSPLLCWFLPSLPFPLPVFSLLPPEELKKPDLSCSWASQQ